MALYCVTVTGVTVSEYVCTIKYALYQNSTMKLYMSRNLLLNDCTLLLRHSHTCCIHDATPIIVSRVKSRRNSRRQWIHPTTTTERNNKPQFWRKFVTSAVRKRRIWQLEVLRFWPGVGFQRLFGLDTIPILNLDPGKSGFVAAIDVLWFHLQIWIKSWILNVLMVPITDHDPVKSGIIKLMVPYWLDDLVEDTNFLLGTGPLNSMLTSTGLRETQESWFWLPT